jgi:hypothetical protein
MRLGSGRKGYRVGDIDNHIRIQVADELKSERVQFLGSS